jgi:diguanylate cyclase (GGDEF)-like protein
MSSEQLPITASFGVASLEQGDDVKALFGRADAALYRAKHEGRNRVRAESGDGPVAWSLA